MGLLITVLVAIFVILVIFLYVKNAFRIKDRQDNSWECIVLKFYRVHRIQNIGSKFNSPASSVLEGQEYPNPLYKARVKQFHYKKIKKYFSIQLSYSGSCTLN